MNGETLKKIITLLKEVRAQAVIAGIDSNFINEVDHLIATALANWEELT